MKTYKIIFYLVVLAAGLVMQSCKDNILTPVTDHKSADSLVAIINSLNSTLVTVNAKDKSITIQLATLNPKLDSLQNINTSSASGQSIEYTVYLYDGSTTVTGSGSPVNGRSRAGLENAKTSGVTGATVTVRSNGQTYTATTVDGRAIFDKVVVGGLVNVTVSASGYTACAYTTYFNPNQDWVSQTGSPYSASSNVMLFPTTGSNVATYTGQLYVNKSMLDDTLGRQYMKGPYATDPLFETFISKYGPYHGGNSSNGMGIGTLYGGIGINNTQNIKFDNVTSLSGQNFIYGYPNSVNLAYPANAPNYQNLPGDILSVTYIGLTSFATIGATGAYTLAIPSYANNPGAVIATISNASLNWSTDDGNLIAYQDNFTMMTGSTTAPAVPVTIKTYDNTTYTTSTFVTNTLTLNYAFAPYMENDNSDYTYIAGDQTLPNSQLFVQATPGQTYNRNIFFFPWFQTGN